MELKKFNVIVERFNPSEGPTSGETPLSCLPAARIKNMRSRLRCRMRSHFYKGQRKQSPSCCFHKRRYRVALQIVTLTVVVVKTAGSNRSRSCMHSPFSDHCNRTGFASTFTRNGVYGFCRKSLPLCIDGWLNS